ncbi:MAG: MATE family efflux transporter [Eubacteriales bacterium]|nr:MATE family efflux transporter [Eubacteriales bacterium]
MKFTLTTQERRSYRELLTLAFPIIIQNLFSAAISSADVVMLNTVGQSAISAASLAVQYSNMLFNVYYGLGTGATILCAQYWGRCDLGAIEKVQGIAFRFSIFFSLLFALPAALIPRLLMQVFTNDDELIGLGASYLRIISVSYLCWSISEIYLSVLRSIERVTVSTALNVSALLLNIFLNAVFVLGWFGSPRLGIQGVALATTISRLVQLAACFWVSARSKDIKIKLGAMFEKGGNLLKDFFRLALPALGNDVVWGAAFSMYSVIMGHMGTDVVAANSLVVVVRNLALVMAFAIANASGIYVGKLIGANQLNEAERAASRSMVLTVAAGILGGILVALLSPAVIRFAALSDTANGYLRVMLAINTYYIMGAAVNTTLIAGLFRAGGDSRFGFICDTIDMWCYAVPLGFLAAFVFKLPPMWVYFLLCTDEFVKWPWVLRHYKSKKWLKNITRENI